jgi:hypothetical protein
MVYPTVDLLAVFNAILRVREHGDKHHMFSVLVNRNNNGQRQSPERLTPRSGNSPGCSNQVVDI